MTDNNASGLHISVVSTVYDDEGHFIATAMGNQNFPGTPAGSHKANTAFEEEVARLRDSAHVNWIVRLVYFDAPTSLHQRSSSFCLRVAKSTYTPVKQLHLWLLERGYNRDGTLADSLPAVGDSLLLEHKELEVLRGLLEGTEPHTDEEYALYATVFGEVGEDEDDGC